MWCLNIYRQNTAVEIKFVPCARVLWWLESTTTCCHPMAVDSEAQWRLIEGPCRRNLSKLPNEVINLILSPRDSIASMSMSIQKSSTRYQSKYLGCLHNTGCSTGILIMVYYNPLYIWVVSSAIYPFSIIYILPWAGEYWNFYRLGPQCHLGPACRRRQAWSRCRWWPE